MIQKSRLIMVVCLLFSLLLLIQLKVFSQKLSTNCEVIMVDFNTDKSITLGSFTVSSNKVSVDEETYHTEKFMIPGSKIFVTASVLYSAKSDYTKPQMLPPDEINLILILGKKWFRNSLQDLVYPKQQKKYVISVASTTLPSESFKVGKVATMYLEKEQAAIVSLECKK